MFRVTRQWIFQFRTEFGAWTYAQFRAIGVSVPPLEGWIDRIEGSMISEDQKNDFESGRTVYSKSKKAARQRAKKLARMASYSEAKSLQREFSDAVSDDRS